MSHDGESSTTSSSSSASDECTSSSGEIYENVDYPLSFVLAGAGRVGSWNVTSVGPDGSRLILSNEAVRHPMRFNFKRLSSGSGSLNDGDIVSVDVKTIEDLNYTPILWQEKEVSYLPPLSKCRFIVFGDVTPGATGGPAFVFNAYTEGKEECDSMTTHINLSPSRWPLDDVPATVDPDPAANLCLSFTSREEYHSVVWPIEDALPSPLTRFQVTKNVLAAGDWVWTRS